MKTTLLLLLLVLPCICYAESTEYGSEITFYAGGFFGDKFITAPPALFGQTQATFDDRVSIGFRYGYFLNHVLEFEGGVGFTPSKVLVSGSSNGGTTATTLIKADTWVFHGNLTANLMRGPVIPYVTGGVGGVHFNFNQNQFGYGIVNPSETDFALNGGGGIKVPLKEDIAIRLDGRVYWLQPEFADNGHITFGEVTGGVSVLFNF